MLNFALEIVCAFLMAMSFIFIIIEMRARFDRSFLIFGITNLLLSIFCAIDIWVQPGDILLNWTRIQHIIAAYFPAFILWYLKILLRKLNFSIVRYMFFIGTCFSILFFTDVMLKHSDKEIVSTMVYNCTFAPFIIGAILYISFFLIRNFSQSAEKDKKVLLFHIFGIAALALGGIMDMVIVCTGHRIVPQIASFTLPGLLLFGLIVTFVFIERMTAIIRNREITFGKLQAAYKEMEEVQSLKELGQSTAIINHEIKNYAFIISGHAEYLLEHAELQGKLKKMIATIGETAIKMSDYSKDILNFSKAKILSDKRPLALFSLMKRCVQTHFPDKQDAIIIEDEGKDCIVYGDWSKLEHAVINIIKNAFEADATHLNIKALRRDTVLLLVIEDDGIGCTEEQIVMLFKSFYTTKKGKGGTGLGMCVIRSTIESHGGYINAYSKNTLKNGSHGLILNIAFPIYQEESQQPEDKKDPVMLIKEGVENLSQIIRIFQNVMVMPHIVQKVEDIDAKKMSLEKTAIYASAESIDQLKKRFRITGLTHAFVKGSQNIVFVVNETKERTIHAFSESYILENLSQGKK